MDNAIYKTSALCYFCGNALVESNGKVTQWPWWAVCPHCQHEPFGQCSCIFDHSDNSHNEETDGGEVKPLWYKPHFIGDSIKGRYDRSIEEVYTLEEADNFVKDLWTGLFALRDNDNILDSRIEDIIDRVIRSQARIIIHPPRCPRTFVVFGRMLLSRNLPKLMSVVKSMAEDLFASGDMRPLQDQDERVTTWRGRIARALSWDLPFTRLRHERWAPAMQTR
jgi:hypothetical protein